MSNRRLTQGLNSIDKFGIVTGLIGLVADCVSLGSLFAISKSAQNPSFYIWLLVLLSIVYSIALVNFYARRYFRRRNLKNSLELSSASYRYIEKGTQSVTYLIGLPILICYFILAFFVDNNLFFDDISIFFHDIRLPITRGLFYGGGFAWLVCYYSNLLILNIYTAFDPSY